MKTFREDLHLRMCCTEIFRKDSFFRLSYIKQGLIFVNQEKRRMFIELNILISSLHPMNLKCWFTGKGQRLMLIQRYENKYGRRTVARN